jgi:hypothetical protein
MRTVFLVIVIGHHGVGRELLPYDTPADAQQAVADAATVGRHAVTYPVTADALRELREPRRKATAA